MIIIIPLAAFGNTGIKGVFVAVLPDDVVAGTTVLLETREYEYK